MLGQLGELSIELSNDQWCKSVKNFPDFPDVSHDSEDTDTDTDIDTQISECKHILVYSEDI